MNADALRDWVEGKPAPMPLLAVQGFANTLDIESGEDLLDSTESNRPAYNLLCHELGLLDQSAAAATRGQALAFRLKLLLAEGFAPELASCAACG